MHGIWPKYSQLNDVNATDASFEHNTIATGDDFGLVKLFRFPSVKKGLYIIYIDMSMCVTDAIIDSNFLLQLLTQNSQSWLTSNARYHNKFFFCNEA